MTTEIAVPGYTLDTFLTHFFGGGLSDDRYVVERFRAMIDGDIRRCPDEAPAKGKGRRKPTFATAALRAVREMGQARNEINLAAGLAGTKGWGNGFENSRA